MALVKYLELLECSCSYLGCKHNEDGYCMVDDPDFFRDILEGLRRNISKDGVVNLDATYDCHKCEEREGYCLYCGEPLTAVRECRGEFWGAPAYETILVCERCGE